MHAYIIEFFILRKLAKKRKETMSSTRQEMTVMVNSMDKSYAEQGTNCDEAFSFMDTHNLNGRCKCISFLAFNNLLGFARFQVVLRDFKKKKIFLKNFYAMLVSPVIFSDPWCHGSLHRDVLKVIGPDQRVQKTTVKFL